MMAPKSILKYLRNMKRKFLWRGSLDPQKWNLVKWGIVCTPKSQGGMGLHDPEKESLVVKEKLWWRLINHTQEPSSKLWHAEYVEGWDARELI